MTNADPVEAWVKEIKRFVAKRAIVLLRLEEEEIQGLKGSRGGMRQFSIARPHDLASGIALPCLCIFFGEKSRPFGGLPQPAAAYMAILKTKTAVTTLVSRLSVRRGVEIQPSNEDGLLELLGGTKFETDFRRRLSKKHSFVPLGPKGSSALVERLLGIEANRGPMRIVSGGLTKPIAESNERLQLEALRFSLGIFGLTEDTPATKMNLAKGAQTSLTRMNVIEDEVIEHDARSVPGYEFVGDGVRGQATFRKGNQTLEVYTANRRQLEEAFGVDLIYLNLFHRNVVLVQYKMLRPGGKRDAATDWAYYQDKHLIKQLKTMRLYSRPNAKSRDGYRLSDDAFYFKFVRRSGLDDLTNVLLPLGHFEEMLNDSSFRTRTGGVRVNYGALEGRYMRQTAFVDLIQAGYIGADASTAEHLRRLIESVVDGDDSLVIAVQRLTREDEQKADHRRLMRDYGVELPEDGV